MKGYSFPCLVLVNLHSLWSSSKYEIPQKCVVATNYCRWPGCWAATFRILSSFGHCVRLCNWASVNSQYNHQSLIVNAPIAGFGDTMPKTGIYNSFTSQTCSTYKTKVFLVEFRFSDGETSGCRNTLFQNRILNAIDWRKTRTGMDYLPFDKYELWWNRL